MQSGNLFGRNNQFRPQPLMAHMRAIWAASKVSPLSLVWPPPASAEAIAGNVWRWRVQGSGTEFLANPRPLYGLLCGCKAELNSRVSGNFSQRGKSTRPAVT